MLLKKIFLLTSLYTTLLFSQNELGINFNSEDIELHGTWDTTMSIDDMQTTRYMVFANYLHTDENNLMQVGLFAENTFQGRQDIFLSFGFKGVLTDDFLALAPSAKGKFYITSFDAPPTYLQIEASYAPSVLSFSDAQRYIDIKSELAMEIISNVVLYTGYRYIHTKYIEEDKTFNSSFYGGMKIAF